MTVIYIYKMGRGLVKGYGSILVSNGAQAYLMVVVLKVSGSDLFLRGVTQLVFCWPLIV